MTLCGSSKVRWTSKWYIHIYVFMWVYAVASDWELLLLFHLSPAATGSYECFRTTFCIRSFALFSYFLFFQFIVWSRNWYCRVVCSLKQNFITFLLIFFIFFFNPFFLLFFLHRSSLMIMMFISGKGKSNSGFYAGLKAFLCECVCCLKRTWRLI